MQRDRVVRRNRAILILLAVGIGFLIGSWQAATTRTRVLSAAQTVALRFPDDSSAITAAAPSDVASNTSARVPISTRGTKAMVLGDAQFGLLNPAPMIRRIVRQAAAAQNPTPDEVDASPSPRPVPAPARHAAEPRPAEVPQHHANRSGFVLNDAQIASIKQRLHLTEDQESMWPAVEAALRNIAYAKAHDAHRHGAPAGTTEVAALDPNSAPVQDLKSAAVPLIMSFNDEQKNEVRSLAHVMGLDNLASAF